MSDFFLTIIGKGAIGLAIARQLSRYYQNKEILLLDKNPKFPSENQSSRNSGVIHAGIYYDKNVAPKKANTCVRGNNLLYQYCKEHNIPFRNTGKLIISTNSEESKILEKLKSRSIENGLEGVEFLTEYEISNFEKNITGNSALYVPSSGIIEPTSFLQSLHSLILKESVTSLDDVEVKDVKTDNENLEITISQSKEEYKFTSRYLINAAGLYSDIIAKKINPEFDLKILPVRGEAAKYYIPNRTNSQDIIVKRNVYPTPVRYQKEDGHIHTTLGVHLTPTLFASTNGEYELDQFGEYKLGSMVTLGPTATKLINGKAIGREDYQEGLHHPSEFVRKVESFFPNIKDCKVSLHQAGIQAVLANGDDFHYDFDKRHRNVINLVGICSPGLTSALAIAQDIESMVKGEWN